MTEVADLARTLTTLRRSRLVPDAELRATLARCPGPAPAVRPAELLARLVAAGHLTPFQADHVARGRWRGFRLGPYLLRDLLGKGGMGQVYLARHEDTGREVALKVLGAKFCGDAASEARFRREAEAAAGLAHPNIVRVFEARIDADPPHIVMEFVEGASLQAAVSRRGPLPPAAAAYLGAQVALALGHAHAAGVVHRDIKPANVLVDLAASAKVLDFGVVKLDSVADDLTLAGPGRAILGTADYLAPEQALDSSGVDGRADLYALGGTLYFLLGGRSPYPDGTPAEKVFAKQSLDPAPLGRLCPAAPPELVALVHQLLARRRCDRPGTGAEVAARLAPFARRAAVLPYLGRTVSTSDSSRVGAADTLRASAGSSLHGLLVAPDPGPPTDAGEPTVLVELKPRPAPLGGRPRHAAACALAAGLLALGAYAATRPGPPRGGPPPVAPLAPRPPGR